MLKWHIYVTSKGIVVVSHSTPYTPLQPIFQGLQVLQHTEKVSLASEEPYIRVGR